MARHQAIMRIVQDIMDRESTDKESIVDLATLIQKIQSAGYKISTTNILFAYNFISKQQIKSTTTNTSTITTSTTNVLIRVEQTVSSASQLDTSNILLKNAVK